MTLWRHSLLIALQVSLLSKVTVDIMVKESSGLRESLGLREAK